MKTLNSSDESDDLMKEAMVNHFALIETMLQSESIVSCERKQKKSLSQIRELIDSIVMKRKLRTTIGSSHYV